MNLGILKHLKICLIKPNRGNCTCNDSQMEVFILHTLQFIESIFSECIIHPSSNLIPTLVHGAWEIHIVISLGIFFPFRHLFKNQKETVPIHELVSQ